MQIILTQDEVQACIGFVDFYKGMLGPESLKDEELMARLDESVRLLGDGSGPVTLSNDELALIMLDQRDEIEQAFENGLENRVVGLHGTGQSYGLNYPALISAYDKVEWDDVNWEDLI